MGNLPKIAPITDEELDRINEKFGMDNDFNKRIGMRLTDAQKAMQENKRLKNRIYELEQNLIAQNATTFNFPKPHTPELLTFLLVTSLRNLNEAQRHNLAISLAVRDPLFTIEEYENQSEN